MLFSRPEVREILSTADVLLAWESVRPVPTVTIDFGGGRTLKRTLNGNIAFYVCAPDGRVVDIIPGLNSPAAFVEDLRRGLSLAALGPEEVSAHHRPRRRPVPERIRPGADVTKYAALGERPLRDAVADRPEPVLEVLRTEGDYLEADTRYNRERRAPKVRGLLSGPPVRPPEITKRVYKEILDCDLDDPYLGLAPSLFGGGAYGGR